MSHILINVFIISNPQFTKESQCKQHNQNRLINRFNSTYLVCDKSCSVLFIAAIERSKYTHIVSMQVSKQDTMSSATSSSMVCLDI